MYDAYPGPLNASVPQAGDDDRVNAVAITNADDERANAVVPPAPSNLNASVPQAGDDERANAVAISDASVPPAPPNLNASVPRAGDDDRANEVDISNADDQRANAVAISNDIVLPSSPNLNASVPAEGMQATILKVQGGTNSQLPVGNGISTAIWKGYSIEQKGAISTHFRCSSIAQFEDEILNLANGIINSQHDHHEVSV